MVWMISTEGDNDIVAGGVLKREEFERGCGHIFEIERVSMRSDPSLPKKKATSVAAAPRAEAAVVPPTARPEPESGMPASRTQSERVAPAARVETVVIPSVAALVEAAFWAQTERFGAMAGRVTFAEPPATVIGETNTRRIKWKDPIVSVKCKLNYIYLS
jgi:hypothetical protein